MKQSTLLVTGITAVVVMSIAHAQDILPYPPMNLAQPVVSATAQRVGIQYQYRYEVSNQASASQQVRHFMIQIRSASVQGFSPNTWRASRASRPTVQAVTWTSLDSTQDILPGTSLSGFEMLSTGLPAVVQFYAVGRIPIPHGEFRILPGTNDPFINSAQGRTIGPADPPTPFNALTFVDTITSYINQSRALGWITDDATANKYRRLIDTARFHLEANNRGVTKARLDSVLVNVYPDSAAGLITSEAYALLRFNTEYVLKKLREEER